MYLLRGGARSAAGGPSAGLLLTEPLRGLAYLASLLIGGEADRLGPAASTRQAAARNPRWETIMLPGVGHTPQLEVPENVIGTIRDWLGRTTPGTR
jgi:pimeloyl-ACP methyl ester carboxylesterase